MNNGFESIYLENNNKKIKMFYIQANLEFIKTMSSNEVLMNLE